jgi:hypothetical protein
VPLFSTGHSVEVFGDCGESRSRSHGRRA